MTDLVHLPAFLAAAATLIALPGPATLLVATRATVSRRAALVATAGIVVADVLAITLAGAGLAGVLARLPGLMQALRWIGAAYVAWLGIDLLRRPAPSPGAPAAAAPSPRHAFVQAIAMTATNPKAMLFFAAFFPMFVAPDAHSPLRAFWTLGAMFEAINVAWFAAIVAVAGTAARRRGSGGTALRRVGGLGLIGCAVLVLLA